MSALAAVVAGPDLVTVRSLWACAGESAQSRSAASTPKPARTREKCDRTLVRRTVDSPGARSVSLPPALSSTDNIRRPLSLRPFAPPQRDGPPPRTDVMVVPVTLTTDGNNRYSTVLRNYYFPPGCAVCA